MVRSIITQYHIQYGNAGYLSNYELTKDTPYTALWSSYGLYYVFILETKSSCCHEVSVEEMKDGTLNDIENYEWSKFE